MLFAELYALRDLFWKLNKQELSCLLKIHRNGTAAGESTKILVGVDRFLRTVDATTLDTELRTDVKRLLDIIAKENANPLAAFG